MALYQNISRVSDSTLIGLINDLSEVASIFTVSFNLAGAHKTFEFDSQYEEDEPEDSSGRDEFREMCNEFEDSIGSSTFFIDDLSISSSQPNFTLRVMRQVTYRYGGPNHNNTALGWFPAENPFVDGLELNLTHAEDQQAEIQRIVADRLTFAVASTKDATTVGSQAESALHGLNAAIQKLVEHTSARQIQLDETRDEIQSEATERFNDLKAKLEVDLSNREKNLAKRIEDLDDRENVHVRRQIQSQMAELVEKYIANNLLANSAKSFWLPLICAVAAVLVIVGIMVTELTHISQLNEAINQTLRNANLRSIDGEVTDNTGTLSNLNSQILFTQIRLAFQGLGVGLLVWFTLRLSTSRYRTANEWELELHKFRLDTERAGFLVEGHLEAAKANGQGLPDIMLQSFSRNLFAMSERDKSNGREDDIAAAIQALIGHSSKFEIGPNGAHLAVDRKGIRGAQKEVSS